MTSFDLIESVEIGNILMIKIFMTYHRDVMQLVYNVPLLPSIYQLIFQQ